MGGSGPAAVRAGVRFAVILAMGGWGDVPRAAPPMAQQSAASPILSVHAVVAGQDPAAREGRGTGGRPREDARHEEQAGGGEAGPGPGAAEGQAAPDESAALAALERAVTEHPLDAETHYALGLALRRAHRRPESVLQFEKAVQIGPPTRARLLDLGVAYADVSRYAEAEAVYRRILAAVPNDADAYHNLANIAVRRGDLERAVDLFRKAIALKPDYLHAHYVLGHALKMLGRRREAYDEYGKVMDLTPADGREQAARIDALYQIGSIDLAEGAFALAEKRFAEVTRVAPDHRNAHWGRAQALLRLGRSAEARKEIETHSALVATQPAASPMGASP